MIERAYRIGEQLGLQVWTEDEAGPYQAAPYPGRSWQLEGEPTRQPHEYVRGGTAKLLTLFHPADGELRVKGVRSSANSVLHPWLKEALTAILAGLPEPEMALSAEENRQLWKSWQEGLTGPITLSAELPALRMLLVLDNLAGHKTPAMVLWMFERGVMPLYTPLGGSWLNMDFVGAAGTGEASVGGTASPDSSANHRVVGGDCARVEQAAYIVRVGR